MSNADCEIFDEVLPNVNECTYGISKPVDFYGEKYVEIKLKYDCQLD